MKKPKKKQPQADSAPVLKETNEQKQARVEAANKALKALCEQYHVAFHVPTLDISSGKIWPTIQLLALDLPK